MEFGEREEDERVGGGASMEEYASFLKWINLCFYLFALFFCVERRAGESLDLAAIALVDQNEWC